jgi:putative phosphoesterase
VRLLSGADLILHGGDFTSAAFADELRALGPPVEAVYGNMDEAVLRDTLPRERVVDVAGKRIGMVHIPGPRAGREARLAGRFPNCDAVVYGHTHVPQVERLEQLWILNPGSPTERRTAPLHSMLLLTIRGTRLTPELVTLAR